MTIAFKSWQNIAVGAILFAISVFLTSSAFTALKVPATVLQGWAMLIIAGYAFVSAIFIGASPLSENKTLTESFPGIFDHFKSFIVAGLFYAIGTFLASVEAVNLVAPEQALTLALSLFVGGALTLVAVLVAISAAFIRPRKQN
jgi:hypothetical protein